MKPVLPVTQTTQTNRPNQDAPMTRTQRNARRQAGFTVTELIVVVSIIALIIALLVPSIAKVRASTRTLRCLTNQRQITQAAYAYATANAGRWASPRTDYTGGITYPENTAGNVRHCWVKAQGTENVTGAFEKISALENGVLWPYTGTVAIYVSPDEPTNPYALQNPGANTRIRSYSFNACLGVTRPDEWPEYDDDFTIPNVGVTVPLSIYNTTTIATVKQPSRMLSTLVEDDGQMWNTHGWIISPQPNLRLWVDLPAPWRPDAVTMTYVDGSTESYEMTNPSILESNYLPFPHWITGPIDASGTCWDWKYFRDRMNPGVLPALPNLPPT